MSNPHYRTYLHNHYHVLCGYTGYVLSFLGLIILAPGLLTGFYPDEKYMAAGFLLPGLALGLLGLFLYVAFRPQSHAVLTHSDGAVIVVVAWCAAIAGGSVPFLWAGHDLTRAVFEATSGWTTTGLSVIDVSTASPLLLMFRSLMQLAGGAGVAILMLSTITGPAGIGLSMAEGRSEQLVPQIRQSARLVMMLYGCYLFAGVLALKLAGMSWFDALNHACCAVSTGGFSTRVESIGYWNSSVIEAVIMVLMLLGATNFLTAYALWRGNWRAVLRNGEIRLNAGLLLLASTLLLFGVVLLTAAQTDHPLRSALFQAITALTTTGYATTEVGAWNSLGWLILILLMLVGGGTGSTAGGFKQHRLYLLFKMLKKEYYEIFLSPGTLYEQAVWTGSQRRFLPESALRKAGMYIALYLLTWLTGSCALTAFGHPLADSFFEFASTLGTVGLSVGLTSAEASDGQLWVQIIGMLLGRLEFFVIFWGVIKLGRDLPTLLSERMV
ncbi:MAG: potassium transporter TrkG [Desulfuromonadales bacterium]|nr:potassium transporter TrkG [Desulfuromonadales bacterium]